MLLFLFFILKPGAALSAQDRPSQSPAPADSAVIDSTAADTLAAPGRMASASAAPGPYAVLSDTLTTVRRGAALLAQAHPSSLDDVFRMFPGLVSGDSSGVGYPVRLNPLGAGFESVKVYLNGIPLDDPLTGGFDWRAVAPEIAAGALVTTGSGFGSASGGAAEVFLITPPVSVPEAVSWMGIAGGAYSANKVSGELRRGLFGNGGMHVRIDKLQQSTEDFANRVENIRYFTRLEQRLGHSLLLSAEGAFFSDNFKPWGGGRKLAGSNTHIQTMLSGVAGETADWSLAYRYAASRHSFSGDGSDILSLRGRSHELAANLSFSPSESVRLGVEGQLAGTGMDNLPADSLDPGSPGLGKLLATASLSAGPGARVTAFGGIRTGGTGSAGLIGGATVSASLGPSARVFLDLRRERIHVPQGALISHYTMRGADPDDAPVGVIDAIEAGVAAALAGGHRVSASVMGRSVADRLLVNYTFRPFEPSVPRFADYDIYGIRYRASGPLFGPLAYRAAGYELFDAPEDVPWLPERRHTAALELGGEFYDGDMGISVTGELIYEGELRFPPVEASGGALYIQPGRVNFGGAAEMRIIDFTIFCRTDYLMGDYYNDIDPLRLPGPRVLAGVNWRFMH